MTNRLWVLPHVSPECSSERWHCSACVQDALLLSFASPASLHPTPGNYLDKDKGMLGHYVWRTRDVICLFWSMNIDQKMEKKTQSFSIGLRTPQMRGKSKWNLVLLQSGLQGCTLDSCCLLNHSGCL